MATTKTSESHPDFVTRAGKPINNHSGQVIESGIDEAMRMTDLYEFRIDGELSPELLATFHPVTSEVHRGETVFTCSVEDDPQMFGVVARCETLGLSLIGLAKTGSADAECGRPTP
ncbi:hypothetical protein AAFP30_07090 [Gordonia sp. CPCC 205515]|uniref:hypothetical protein n=1 Tax=Gordonia sp. CPCC 205515 TaxID=3140791 RepID=UPI003AF3FDCE